MTMTDEELITTLRAGRAYVSEQTIALSADRLEALTQPSGKVSEPETTERGFRINRFEDANGVGCSLQESSLLADEGHVWLGCNDIGLKRFEPYKGWTDVVLEQSAPYGVTHVANTRMHLSQSQVAALIPALQHFASTGELPRAALSALEGEGE